MGTVCPSVAVPGIQQHQSPIIHNNFHLYVTVGPHQGGNCLTPRPSNTADGGPQAIEVDWGPQTHERKKHFAVLILKYILFKSNFLQLLMHWEFYNIKSSFEGAKTVDKLEGVLVVDNLRTQQQMVGNGLTNKHRKITLCLLGVMDYHTASLSLYIRDYI